jgi:uncharacterized protein with GYD domain
MATYLMLGQWTDQGIRNVKETTRRAEAFKAMATKGGAVVKDLYWTLGQYDLASIIEAPDDMTVNTLLVSLGALGNLRTQTLRAFSSDEMDQILAKMV